MIRRYGLYSNAHRGKMRKAGADHSHPPIIKDEPKVIDRIIAHLELSFQAARPTSHSSDSAGTPDGSRGERGVFLRASVSAFC